MVSVGVGLGVVVPENMDKISITIKQSCILFMNRLALLRCPSLSVGL